MKAYDPRYYTQRTPNFYSKAPPRAWSIETETMAVRHRLEIAAGKCWDDYDELKFFHNKVAEPHLWEDHFYRILDDCYESEVRSYERLKDLQGTLIPKFFNSGTLISTETRAIEPHVVLMEYIDGISLSDIVPGSLDIPLTLYQPLMDAVEEFKGRDMFHGDITGDNVLISPPEAPSRIVLIDFGQAGLKGFNVPEEYEGGDWESTVDFHGDPSQLRATLQLAGVKGVRSV